MESTLRSPGALLGLGAALLLTATFRTDSGASRRAPADSWGPFRDLRVVSASGRHYAVLRSRKGVWPGPFELLRRRDGAPPIERARAGEQIEVDGGGVRRREVVEVDPDEEDRVLVEGTLPQLPMDAAVSDEPLGIVLFDRYARVGHGRTLTFLDEAGEISWSHTLEDLFGGVPEGTVHTVSSRWWSAAFGIDERLGMTWVLSRGGEFRAVSLDAGEVSIPSDAQLAGFCASASADASVAVLNGVMRREGADLSKFLPVLLPVAMDETTPLSVRLRAAVICHRAGDRVDHSDWFVAATRAEDVDDALFAVLHVPEIAPQAEQIDPLIAILSRLDRTLEPREQLGTFLDPGQRLRVFVSAFQRAGDAGRDRLRTILHDERTSPTGLISASVVWWKLGGTGLPERLRELIVAGSEPDANRALNAMIYSEPEGLNDILLDLAREGTADDVRLALWFRKHPHPDAVESLERMLEVPRDDEWEVKVMREALEACRRGR